MRAASLVLLAALLAAACAAPMPRGVAGKDVQDAATALDATVRRILERDGVARGDGYLYGLDVAWLMLYAARAGDRALYDSLRPYADRLIVRGDPYTRGFVLWRQRPGTDPEVAGAGEGVAMARALLAGATGFGYARDRELAQQVLEGYGKLAFEKGMSWSVRRHFNFATRSFSDAAFLSGYAPDLLAEAAGTLQPAASWPTPVERSYAAIELASADNGLLRVVMLPELDETWADLPQRAFAPNNVTSLEESCLAAEGAVRGRPQVARDLLAFARDSDHTNFLGRLFAYFDVATGEPAGEALLTPIGYACLVRLAVAVGDTRAVAELGGWFTRDLALIAGEPGVHPAPLYAAGPLLLAAQALKALPGRSESAAVQTSNVAGQGRPRGENP